MPLPWSEPSAPARASALHMHVFFEIFVIMGVKQHPSFEPFVIDLLQRYMRTSYIPGKVLTGTLIDNPHAVVYAWSFAPLTARPGILAESRVLPGE